ncbi:uncharacterized protein MYCFIDRAFT_131394 [Pseudocercospora fijiensis CIRAD86]|uniref:DUF1308 domain-containing protein n=1 Tax=Pseudocercospora fijiensis (strain CIRAD86) TaxID=383855 RepID=M3BAH3_PSEFD|nr:uncharacterized protein MYCFIDRAFT_131394 [Pseudocercospora fijiensis CIRAD86]EME86238.1 hypothetical protein MYCFIDRAFT_131394 [Pseudocercospora fijiensis CIRAD86]
MSLAERSRVLLAELESFRHHLRTVRQEQHVEIAHFRGTVQSELSMLERLANKPESESTSHVARSSNVPFLEAVWSTAKKSEKVLALTKRIYFNSPSKSLSQAMHHVNLGPKKRPMAKGSKDAAVTVDAITEGGLRWIKVSLVTNNRILFDLAKQGWNSGGSEDEEEEQDSNVTMIEEESDVPLVRNARDLCNAAQSYRVRTRKPQVHLILPRVQEGETDKVDDVLDLCRAAGAVLHCGGNLDTPPVLDDALPRMAPDPMWAFSEKLNIDCTILLALVSDFSHSKVSKESWFHKALRRQVEIEDNENLLPSLLYPATRRHILVCTKEASKRMREIVSTIGTPSEKARTAIMMGDDNSKSQEDLINEMQQWSAYEVPADWLLPIRDVDRDEDHCLDSLPAVASSVAEHMTDINKSVFLHGWGTGRTTISSNRTVVRQLETDLEKYDDLPETAWPKIWLCPTSRSLVGKEKRGAKKEGAWPLPDPL